MANLIGSYSPNDVSITYGGIPMTGHPEGQLVSAEFDEDAATLVEGADNAVAIARKRGPRMATVKLRLLQTSMANSTLQALKAAQEAPGFNLYPPLQILNAQGGEVAIIPRAVIVKEPALAYSDGIEAREWTIKGQATMGFAGFEV